MQRYILLLAIGLIVTLIFWQAWLAWAAPAAILINGLEPTASSTGWIGTSTVPYLNSWFINASTSLAFSLGTTTPSVAFPFTIQGAGLFTGTTSVGALRIATTTQIIGLATGSLGCARIQPDGTLANAGADCGTGGGGGTPGGADTQVQYNDATTFNGSPTFVFIKTSSHIGISTATPYAYLSVGGNLVADSIIATSTQSNSGIGTSTPGILFSVHGPELINGTSTILGGLLTPSISATSSLGFYTGGAAAPRMYINSSGNVGIGSTSPAQFFSIAGNTYLTGGLGVGTGTTSSGGILARGVIESNSQLLGAIISSVRPGVAFTGDTGTGIGIQPGAAGSLSLYTSGGIRFSLNSGGFIGALNGSAVFTSVAGVLSAPTFAFTGDINTGIFNPKTTGKNIAFITNGIQRAMFDNQGFFGIGTTAPRGTLAVAHFATSTDRTATIPAFVVSDTGTSTPDFIVLNANGFVGVATSVPWGYYAVGHRAFSNNTGGLGNIGASQLPTLVVGDVGSTTDFMILNQNGFVGVATNTPGTRLAVAGAAVFTSTIAAPSLSAFVSGDSAVCSGAHGELTIDSGVSSCIVSSRAYKHNISPFSTPATDIIMKLPVFNYQFNSDKPGIAKDSRIGLMAEDTYAIDPRLVNLDPETGKPKGIRTEDVIGLLIKTLQEQQKEIEQLKIEVKALKIR